MLKKGIYWLLVVCLLSSILACEDEQPGEVVERSQQELDAEESVLVGKSLNEYLQNAVEYDVLNSNEYPEAYTYINQLIEMLVQTPQVMNRTFYDWNIYVIHDDSRTAVFSLPGGRVFIYTGLLRRLESEAELISLLAHEIFINDQDLSTQKLVSGFGGSSVGNLLIGTATEEDKREYVEFLASLRLDNELVYQADSAAIETLCPFRYDVLGTLYILNNYAEQSGDLSVEWIEARVTDISERKARIKRTARGCGDIGRVYTERYMEFLTFLP